MALALEEYDIYDEAAFPHEWNYGLSDFPLPKHLSVSDNPREGDFEFEYIERTGWEPGVWHTDTHGRTVLCGGSGCRICKTRRIDRDRKRKFRRRPPQRTNYPAIIRFPDPPTEFQVEDGFHMSLAELIDRAKPVQRPLGEFPAPIGPITKTWHYIWQTKKVLACTGKGCQLCLR